MTEYGAELVSGLYSYLPKNAAIPIEIRDGPLMAEITQVFSDHAVLKTRVFKPQQRCAHSRLLQQVILLDRLNLTDEATLFVTSNVRNGGKVMVDEGGAGGREVEMVSLTYGCMAKIGPILRRQLPPDSLVLVAARSCERFRRTHRRLPQPSARGWCAPVRGLHEFPAAPCVAVGRQRGLPRAVHQRVGASAQPAAEAGP